MRRRDFISLLGSAAAAWPLAARAQQQPAPPVIGFLDTRSPEAVVDRLRQFRQGLKDTGYTEGENVIIAYRWAENDFDRLPVLAAELVGRGVAVVVASGSINVALAAKAATTTIPIVFGISEDPVIHGLVASLARPGGNITGVTQLTTELVAKQLEVLHEMLPTARLIALLVNPTQSATTVVETREAALAARNLGLELPVLNASTEADFDGVFAKLIELRAGGLVISAAALFSGRSAQLGELTARRAVPAVYKQREFAAAGGLMSYGTNLVDAYRLAGVYTGRVLKGAKPADLPVQQATKVELYINLKTAKALGLTVPLPLSGRADELFE